MATFSAARQAMKDAREFGHQDDELLLLQGFAFGGSSSFAMSLPPENFSFGREILSAASSQALTHAAFR